jgi:hypothetical protein
MLSNKINTIIHPINMADFDSNLYNTIIATATTTITLNGDVVTLNVGTITNVVIKTVSGADIILMGSPSFVYNVDENL